LIFFRASVAFSLGLERTGGFETVAFCEIEEYPRKVLARHWPGVPIYDDVRTLTADTLRRDGIAVDVICGGFPCQDISDAGLGAGLDGERSGLWREYARLIREVRPRFVLVENVAALTRRGLGRVLGDLAASGYDAEWECLGADAIGASQERERVWILANPNNTGRKGPIWAGKPHQARPEWAASCCEPLRSNRGYWPPGPRSISDIPRMVDGSSDRMDRCEAIGNAVVPQIPELIGRAILKSMEPA
jgi:DNA (cytosine-5)-methyltransferase 1